MALRTGTATWFEVLTSREELGKALLDAAETGAVQLESHSQSSAAQLLPALRALSDEYRRLAQHYGQYWPAPARRPIGEPRELTVIGESALARLRAWAAQADILIGRTQALATLRTELERLRAMLSAASGPGVPDLALLARAGPVLSSAAYQLAAAARPLPVPPQALIERIEAGAHCYLLAIGPSEALAALEHSLGAEEARRVMLPAWLPARSDAALAAIDARLAEASTESRRLADELAQLNEAYRVAAARADAAFIDWLTEHVPELPMTERFAWITGWTNDPSGAKLRRALEQRHAEFLLRFPAAPAAAVPPVVLRNPRWAKPFERFAHLLGVPGAREADPSEVLAVVAPLLFGFMFGDVAQGAVLLAVGVLARKRYPALTLLIPGGIAAMGFGVLFGSILAREDIAPALWVRPLAHPLTLLRVSLVLGSAIILLGLTLDAVQQRWAERLGGWWATRGGVVLAYLGLLASLYRPRALWAIPAGLLWCALGRVSAAPQRPWKALGDSLTESLEALMQLLVNTLSFVRVGAFAIAHAGLASAVVAIAAIAHVPAFHWLLLLLGNALMIVIETLVAGIQTTRLVLFEFFIRFLQGAGRPFCPLPYPDPTRSTL